MKLSLVQAGKRLSLWYTCVCNHSIIGQHVRAPHVTIKTGPHGNENQDTVLLQAFFLLLGGSLFLLITQ